jgi:hypothetical protein
MAEDEKPARRQLESMLEEAAKVRASAAEAVLRARQTRWRVAADLDRLRRGRDPDSEKDLGLPGAFDLAGVSEWDLRSAIVGIPRAQLGRLRPHSVRSRRRQ